MAKLERRLTGNFDGFLSTVEDGILKGSVSAHLEDGSDFRIGDIRCAVRVFERYSWFGGNRVSLSLTLLGDGDKLTLSAIAAGGSGAMFFKLNTIGEDSFLNRLEKIVDVY